MQVSKVSHLSHNYPLSVREIENMLNYIYVLADLPNVPAITIIEMTGPALISLMEITGKTVGSGAGHWVVRG